MIKAENTDHIDDEWDYFRWTRRTASHDAIMNLALSTICGCTIDDVLGRLDVAFFADLMAPPRDPRERDALRMMWRSAHVIASTLRAKLRGFPSVEQDSQLDIWMQQGTIEAEEQHVKVEPEMEIEPAGGSAAQVSQDQSTERTTRRRPSTAPLMATAVKAAAVASTLTRTAQGLPQSSRSYEIQVDVKENWTIGFMVGKF